MKKDKYHVITSYEIDSSLYTQIVVIRVDTKEVVEQTQLYLGDSSSIEEMIEKTDKKILKLKAEYNGIDEELVAQIEELVSQIHILKGD